MKAATINKQCISGPGGTVRGGSSGPTHGSPASPSAAHMPRRHAVTRHPVAQQLSAGFSSGAASAPPSGLPNGLPRRLADRLSDGGVSIPRSSYGAGAEGGRIVPRVLHVDSDSGAATILTALLVPDATVVHVTTLAEARRLLRSEIFSLCILDPGLSDGDGGALLPALATTPLLVYSARQPDWRDQPRPYLPKPWTSPRQLWSTISTMLGIAPGMTAGD